MPDIKWTKKEDIPEGLREHAEEKDGAFVVDVSPAKKVKEFRDNNIALSRERDELKNKVTTYAAAVGEDVTAITTELTELRSIKQKVDDGKLTGSDKIEATVASRVKAIEDGYKTQIAEGNTKLANTVAKAQAFEMKFKRATLREEITAVVTAAESGANPVALGDILACAEADFAVGDDGKIVRMNGDAIVYGADGVTAMPPKEWLTGLLKSKPYFQKPSAGGGATGGRTTGSDYGMSDEAFNKLPPAERMRIAREKTTR